MEPTLHWEEGEDERGYAAWFRFVGLGHWGLFMTGVFPRWLLPPFDIRRSTIISSEPIA